MPELTDQSTTSWAHVLGANLPASVESLRCVEYERDSGFGMYTVTVRHDGTYFLVSVSDCRPDRYATLVGLLTAWMPRDDATLANLHKLRAQTLAPVSFVCEPEPATAAD